MKKWQRMKPDDEKLRELILYICSRSEGDERFGATKLNKLLWLADFTAYLRFGQAITWQEYQALEHGPAPRSLLPMMDQMERDREIATRTEPYYDRPQKRTLALREPDLSKFTAQEIELVTSLIREWWGKNATEISEASHGFMGWKLAERGETIPYESALVTRRELTKHEEEVARELARSLGES